MFQSSIFVKVVIVFLCARNMHLKNAIACQTNEAKVSTIPKNVACSNALYLFVKFAKKIEENKSCS